MRKTYIIGLAAVLILLLVVMVSGCSTDSAAKATTAKAASYNPVLSERKASKTIGLTDADNKYITCHEASSPNMVKMWKDSLHFKAEAGCTVCHTAQKDDFDAMEHNGFIVAKTPNAADCQTCHATQTEQFLNSKHAMMGINMGLDNNMNWRKPPIYRKTQGCVACHTGMGNYWPDKTIGDCTQCHAKHE